MVRKVTGLPVQELSVALTNADQNRLPIDTIVIHTMVGSISSSNSRFNDPSSKVSAHYGVGYSGQLVHWVDEDWVAYHAGNYNVNQRSIGIEHEDYGNYNGPRPDALYTASSQLVADICSFYGIPCDRAHILKHSEIVATGCPDALDIDRIVAAAAQILNRGGSTSIGGSNISLDQDHLNALADLESYRKIRMQGPGGNFQGFVDAIIGSDRDLPGIKQQLIVYQSQTPINATILSPSNTIPSNSSNGIVASNSLLGIAWSWLKGKKTYIISGLIIGWTQLNAMGYIDSSTFQTGLSILGALGLAAIRMGMSNN